MIGPIIVSPRIAAKALDWGLLENVFSAKWNDEPKTVVLVKSSFVAQTS